MQRTSQIAAPRETLMVLFFTTGNFTPITRFFIGCPLIVSYLDDELTG
jgi:hypothetical protein